MIKKMVCMMLAAALAVSVTACGGGTEGQKATSASKEATGGAEQGKDGTKTKLVVWGAVPAERGPGKVVEMWNERHPDIEVEYVRFTNDDTGIAKLDTALLAGEQIDIFLSYYVDDVARRFEGGILEDLEPYGAGDFVESELVGGKDSCLLFDDKLFCIPTMSESYGIMINQKMLDEAGITIPDNWTLDEFEEIARKLTKTKDDGQKVYGTILYHETLPLNIPRAVLGADYLYKNENESNFDHPVFKVNTQFKKMMDEGIAMPYDEVFSRDFTSHCWVPYLNEEVAMIPFTSWVLRNVKNVEEFPHDFKSTFAPFPAPEEEKQALYQTMLNGWISMSSKAKDKAACWEFIKFWITEGSRPNQQLGAKQTAWNKISEEDIVSDLLGNGSTGIFDVQAYKDTFDASRTKYLVGTMTKAYSQITSIYDEENEKYFLGGIDEEQYYKNLKERADAAIAAY